ncbi:MAG: hypothetical protein ACLQGP_12055 [Isosphaeraceae bacterium]
MSSQVLDPVNSLACNVGDLVGVFATSPGLNAAAVEHVAMLVTAKSLVYGDTVDVRHMGPSVRPDRVGSSDAHVVGQIVQLGALDRSALEAWVRDLDTRIAPLQYQVLPHYEVVLDPGTGVPAHVRCSCVGLLVEAIKDVLTRTPLDPSSTAATYPDTDLATLQTIFPSSFLRRRARAGLTGSGPWPVVLPGHLVHAMNQQAGTSAWPYNPASGDYLFP